MDLNLFSQRPDLMYLLFRELSCECLVILIFVVEEDSLSAFLGSSLLPAEMLIVEGKWFWCHILLLWIKTSNEKVVKYQLIIIKSKCLITEERPETLVQSESQEESRQAMLTHTEHSIAVRYLFFNNDNIL